MIVVVLVSMVVIILLRSSATYFSLPDSFVMWWRMSKVLQFQCPSAIWQVAFKRAGLSIEILSQLLAKFPPSFHFSAPLSFSICKFRSMDDWCHTPYWLHSAVRTAPSILMFIRTKFKKRSNSVSVASSTIKPAILDLYHCITWRSMVIMYVKPDPLTIERPRPLSGWSQTIIYHAACGCVCSCMHTLYLCT